MIPKRIYFVMVVVLFAAASSGSDVSEAILSDIITILGSGTVHLLGDCTGSNNSAPETQYWIYTRNHPDTPEIINDLKQLVMTNESRIFLLAHGWNGFANTAYMKGIKDAYLKRYDNAYVISIDWSAYAIQAYASAVCALAGVATNVADFMCELNEKFKISLKSIHTVGHSLGAQLFGLAGKLVQDKCQEKIGRITGLDPAGPLFNGVNEKYRLDPTDAIFVDVIHTSVGQLGYYGSCGHLDAYANCGRIQPGCANFILDTDLRNHNTTLIGLPVEYLICGHQRSCQYFEESINSDKFLASPCEACELPMCFPKIWSHEKQVIGEDCTKPGKVRDYVFFTNSSPPFAKG